MGYEVISLGGIEFLDKQTPEFLESVVARILEIDGDAEYISQCKVRNDNFIEISMSGYKGVGYDSLEKIADELHKQKIRFSLAMGEYVEAQGEGLYIESEEME